jgi:hypothetical protein
VAAAQEKKQQHSFVLEIGTLAMFLHVISTFEALLTPLAGA